MTLAIARHKATVPTPTRGGFIIWGNRKLISQRDKAVTLARQHPRLQGREVMARGVCSLVFDRGETVLKLTVDALAYRLAEQQAKWRCPGLPSTLGLYGQVGINEVGAPLWLMEQERLTPLQQGSQARKHCLQIGRMVRDNIYRCTTVADRLNEILPRITDADLNDALRRLASFAAQHADMAGLDMHASNFMLRESTDTPVITDPFLDLGVRHLAQQHCIRVAGLPENTAFF